jgi:glucose/arabinose dehydrogenase
MTWRTLTAIVLAGVAVAGCNSPFGRKQAQADSTAQAAAATAQPAETLATHPAPPTPQPSPAPATQPSRAAPVATGPLMDEPWTPTDTGTVSPGMTREQVVAVWGAPVTERTVGTRTYLFYRNGCEVTCGTFDVVFLDDGQVVDAIVRGRGHTYSGTSSSPAGRPAGATLTRPPLEGGSATSP